MAQSWEEIPVEQEQGKKRKYRQMTAESIEKMFLFVSSSLPQSLFARPHPSLLSDGHLGHPVREALLWALTLQVAPGVANQEWQQSGHFLLQTGSLLG